MIELRDLTYTYPGAEKPVLDRFSLDVDDGEMLLVAGPSGCGKSSLLRVFNGLVPHFHGGRVSGTVRVDGLDPIAVGPRGMSRRVGFVHQNPEAHFVTRKVEDELAFAMENHAVDPGTMRRRIEEVLDQLAIAHLRDRDIDTLSGGERQRVAVAGVLTLQPQILVLDEPTSQLDPQSAEDVLTALCTLNHDFGLTLIVAEHRLERIAQYADRLLLLGADAPRLGEPDELLLDSPLAPPLAQMSRRLGWNPAALTLKGARRRREWKTLSRKITESPADSSPEAAPEPGDGSGKKRSTAVSAEGLWLTYDMGAGRRHEALRNVDVELPKGTVTALLGRNGSGKSSLLKVLVGLLKADRGRVRLETDSGPLDPKAEALHEIAQQVGFVPQNPSRLLFHDTVEEELRWSLKQRRADDDAERELEIRELEVLVDQLELGPLKPCHPRDLSTGERQRVALAVALAGRPSILLLDEPTRGLDLVLKERLTDELLRRREQGVTVLLATHDVELAARAADRVILMGGGRTIDQGPAREVLHDSPVFGTRINRLFRDPRLHVLDDLEPWLDASETGPVDTTESP